MVTMGQQLPFAQRGTSLIEVLITIIIMAFGLLGLAGMQARLQSIEFEAYQRTQALSLLSDMAQRIAANRNSAATYVTTAADPIGATSCPTASTTRQQADIRQWCLALQGAAETLDGASAGAMVGGRGCIESLGGSDYLVTIAWQGKTPAAAPSAGIACGKDLYDQPGTACMNDSCRRVVTTIVRVTSLL